MFSILQLYLKNQLRTVFSQNKIIERDAGFITSQHTMLLPAMVLTFK